MTAAAAAAAPPALEARGLRRSFGSTLALDNLSFCVEAGELYGLVGPDGAGKTTAIRALTGLVDVDAGEAWVLGRDPRAGGAAVRASVGLMPQQASLYPDLSVGENLRFFARLYGLSRNSYRQRTERLMSITRLGRFMDRRADALSGGMYKKLALACALLHRPAVLLLDEPTNGVDPVSRRELWGLLWELVGGGTTILVSTPYMDEAERCHRVGLIHRGRLLDTGSPAELLAGFGDETYEVDGASVASAERARLEGVVSSLSEVRASSPAGARLRLVVAAGGATRVEAALAPLGARLREVPPTFEDLFLDRIGREEAS